VVVRANEDLGRMASLLRHEIKALDPALPVYNLKTVEEIVNSSVARNQMMTRIIGAFSAMALTLAVVGVYGVILSNLVRRTKEFSIRIAIGSSFKHITWLVFREGFLLVLLGMAAGTLVAFVASRSLSSLLFGIGRIDVPSYSIAAGAQLLVVTVGCMALLRRITRLDPLITLKNG
jgi:ABC-type antimicrobial peptide transport system permease subunit